MASLDEVFTDRRAGAHSRGSVAPEDGLQGQLGQDAGEVLKRFEAARARGLDVTANMYPYDRASNGLDACLPLWVREGGLEPMLEAAAGSRAARAHQARHGRREREGLGEPVVRLRRRRRRDAVVGARTVAAQVGGQDARRRSARRWARTRATRRWTSSIADRGESRVIISIMREDDVRTRAGAVRSSRSAPTRARRPRTARCRNPSRIRAPGDRSRASSGSTCATRSCITLEEAVRRFTSRPACARRALGPRRAAARASRPTSRSSIPRRIRDVSTFDRSGALLGGRAARAGERAGRRVERDDHHGASGRGAAWARRAARAGRGEVAASA